MTGHNTCALDAFYHALVVGAADGFAAKDAMQEEFRGMVEAGLAGRVRAVDEYRADLLTHLGVGTFTGLQTCIDATTSLEAVADTLLNPMIKEHYSCQPCSYAFDATYTFLILQAELCGAGNGLS